MKRDKGRDNQTQDTKIYSGSATKLSLRPTPLPEYHTRDFTMPTSFL